MKKIAEIMMGISNEQAGNENNSNKRFKTMENGDVFTGCNTVLTYISYTGEKLTGEHSCDVIDFFIFGKIA